MESVQAVKVRARFVLKQGLNHSKKNKKTTLGISMTSYSFSVCLWRGSKTIQVTLHVSGVLVQVFLTSSVVMAQPQNGLLCFCQCCLHLSSDRKRVHAADSCLERSTSWLCTRLPQWDSRLSCDSLTNREWRQHSHRYNEKNILRQWKNDQLYAL